MIGDVEKSFERFLDRQTTLLRDPLWQAYYNGWLEGRGDMLMQMEREKRTTVDKTSMGE